MESREYKMVEAACHLPPDIVAYLIHGGLISQLKIKLQTSHHEAEIVERVVVM